MEKQDDEGMTIEQMQDQVKSIIFKVNNHLLKQLEQFNEYFYFLLIFIQSIQILWFSMHPTFSFIEDSIGMTQLQQFLRYFNAQSYLRQISGAWQIGIIIGTYFVILAFVITIIHLASLGVTGYLLCQKVVSETAEICARVTNVQILLMNTILTGPIFSIVSTTLYCDSKSPYHYGQVCYDTKGIIMCVLACIVGIVLVVQGVMFAFIYYIKNPFSRSFLSAPSNIYYVGKLCLKTLPVLYFIIDPELQYKMVYVFAYVIVFAAYIFFFRIFSFHTYDQKFYYFIFSCEVFLTWMGIVNILQFYLSVPTKPNLILIFSCLGSLPLCYTFFKIQQESKKKVFLEGIRNLKKNKEIAEEFIYIVISLIQTVSNRQNRILLLGFMKIHNGGCDREQANCKCHQFFQAFYQRKKTTPEQNSHFFYEFLRSILHDYRKKYPGLTVLKIIKSYLLYFKVESKIQAIYEITQIEKQKVSFAQAFMIYRLKLLFLQQSQQKDSDLSQDKGQAVKTYLKFNESFLKFQNEVKTCSTNHLDYWRQLKQDFPSILKLWNLAKQFQTQVKNTEKYFHQVCETFSNNITTLLLYSDFLRNILLNPKQAEKLNQKIKLEKLSAQSNVKDMSDMKFRQNSNLCVITMTTNYKNMGIVLDVNSQLQKMLGYTKSDIKGQKLTKIMPKAYYDIHDSFVIKYLNRPDKEVQSKQFTVFALSKKGFLVQCSILTKLIPEIQNGFHLVGFMKVVEETSKYIPHYIMYDGDNYNIQAISQTCVRSLNIVNQNFLKGNNSSQITVNYLFPKVDFEQLENRPQLKLQGFQTMIDKKVVSDDFSPYQNSEAEIYSQNRNGSLINVKVYLLKESYYQKIKLKFIKFFLLTQEQDQKQYTKQQKEDSVSNQSDRNDTHSEEQSSCEKKYKKFVSLKSTKKLFTALIIGMYSFMIFQFAILCFDVNQNQKNSNQVISIFQMFNQSNTALLCLNNANYDNKKLEITYQLNLSQTQFNKYQLHQRNSIMSLEKSMTAMIKIVADLQSKYGYQPMKYYDTYSFYNRNSPPIKQIFQYSDGVAQFIIASLVITNTSYEKLNVFLIESQDLLAKFFYVKVNGMSHLNDRSLQKHLTIRKFFENRFKIFQSQRKIILGVRMASIMVIFLIVIPIIIKLNKISHTLLGIYKLIPLEDIEIIEQNSFKFINQYFETLTTFNENNQKQEPSRSETSDSKSQIDNKQNILPMNSSLSSKLHPALSSLRPAQTEDVLLSFVDQQRISLKRNSIVLFALDQVGVQKKLLPRVKMSEIPSVNLQMVVLIIIICALIGYFVAQYYIYSDYFKNSTTNLTYLGQYKTIASISRQSLLFAQQLFSQYTINYRFYFDYVVAYLYPIIDHLSKVRPGMTNIHQTIYGSMEELTRLLNQSPVVQTMKQQAFLRLQQNLHQVQIDLIYLSNQFIQYLLGNVKDIFQKYSYVKFVIQMLVVALLIKILFSVYLQKVRMRTYRSTSMALMVPISIVQKNSQIIAML